MLDQTPDRWGLDHRAQLLFPLRAGACGDGKKKLLASVVMADSKTCLDVILHQPLKCFNNQLCEKTKDTTSQICEVVRGRNKVDYFSLLDKVIKEAKLNYLQVTRLCEDELQLNENYLYTNKSRKTIPPDNISRAIARACSRNEELMVVQRVYDQSPSEMKRLFNSMIRIVKAVALETLANKSTKEAFEATKMKLDEFHFAEWLEMDFTEIERICDHFLTNIECYDITNFHSDSLEDICYHTVTDDSMSPLIPVGAQVSTMLVALQNLKSGDYLCRYDDKDEIYIRQIEFLGDQHESILLKPLHNNGGRYKTELIDASDKSLYEKVSQVIVNFE